MDHPSLRSFLVWQPILFVAIVVLTLFSTTPGVASVVINEIHADPQAGLDGDANGDGVRHVSQDEFVEIVNNSGGDLDLSGWTLADATTIRHTFPPETVLPNLCAIVVFGGGTPTDRFGNSLVQTASSGSLGLNNTGDTVTLNDGISDVASAAYGSEGGDNQSITLDPDILGALPYTKHTVASGSDGVLFSPGTRIDGTPFGGCLTILDIFEIQGDGLTSPFEDKMVLTEDNIVTALRDDGFFMQTPTARTDGDIDTSDGIFVYTDSPPAVNVGDLVDVLGRVKEFSGMTEISDAPAVSIVGSGTVPAPLVLDATVPSPDPLTPSCSIEFECYEGMRIKISGGTVTGPNQSLTSDPVAEVSVVAAANRTFRETGTEFPGLGIPAIPTWDGNPEVFKLDPDRLGLTNPIVPAGSTFDAIGVLGFESGRYELWPTDLTVNPVTLPRPVRLAQPGEFTVGTLNLFRLFDDLADDGEPVLSSAAFEGRLAKLSHYIRQVLRAPDVLAVQEAEKLGVLQALAARIEADEPEVVYSAFLIEGRDAGGIDIGFLVQERAIRVDAVTQLGADEVFSFAGIADAPLHDRPPLLLEASHIAGDMDFPINVMVVHNLSRVHIDDPVHGPRVRQKRLEQAQSIAQKIQALQDAEPGVHLVVIGDFNAFEFTDGLVDVVGQIKGDVVPAENLICQTDACPDVVEPDLTNVIESLVTQERYSFILNGSSQALDHALISRSLDRFVRGAAYGRGNADAAADLIHDATTARRASDHDGLVLFIDTSEFSSVPQGAGASCGNFVLFADRDVTIDRPVFSAGDIHANNDIDFKKGKASSHTGNLTAVDDIDIKKHNTVYGDITAGDEVDNDGVIIGVSTANAPVEPISLPVLSFSAGGDDIEVPKRGFFALPPDTYGEVEVEKHATLSLHTGVYFLTELKLERNAALEIDVSNGPVTINVANRLRFFKDTHVSVTPSGEPGTTLVTFNYSGSNKVRIGKRARFLGTIMAPEAKVELNQGATFQGSLCAHKIRVKKNATFLHHGANW